MSALLKFEVQAAWIECYLCHVSFAITSGHQEQLRESKNIFYCPNGHSQAYLGETKAEQVRQEMQAQVDAANRTRDWALDQERKSAKEAKEARKKLKIQTKRVEAGVSGN